MSLYSLLLIFISCFIIKHQLGFPHFINAFFNHCFLFYFLMMPPQPFFIFFLPFCFFNIIFSLYCPRLKSLYNQWLIFLNFFFLLHFLYQSLLCYVLKFLWQFFHFNVIFKPLIKLKSRISLICFRQLQHNFSFMPFIQIVVEMLLTHFIYTIICIIFCQVSLQQSKNTLQIRMSVSSATVGGKIKFKLVLLGDQHVGKSSIIDRFINDKFEEFYNATIGIDFLVRNIAHNNRTYRLQLWDTAGQQRFRALIPSYLKDSNCALIVFDASDPKTLESAARWLQFYMEHKQPLSIGVLVGNKIDLQRKQPNSCTQQQIKETANRLGVPFYLISAKTGEGINELFLNIIDHINEALKKQSSAKLIQQKKEQQKIVQSKSTRKVQENIKLDKAEAVHRQVHQIKSPCC